MQNKEVFKRFILKQIAGEVVWSADRHSFLLSLRNNSSTIREAIHAEGRKWDMSDRAIDDLVNTVINNVELSYKPGEVSVQYVDVANEMEPGQELRLEGTDWEHGKARLSLMCLGVPASTGLCRFMVLSATRIALQPEDVVEPADNTLWAVGHPVMLSVYRHGQHYPDAVRVYRTYKLDSIIKIVPSVIHEIIDSRCEFTHDEHTARQFGEASGDVMSFGRNAMSLLLHEYSHVLPIYADFDEHGSGTFRSVPSVAFEPSHVRDILFGITNETIKHHTLYITTEEPGILYLDTKELKLQLRQAAQAKTKMKT